MSIVATNSVSAGGQTVKARIDPALTVQEVIKQLCVNLQMRRPAADFALRDEHDELVTDANLRRTIKNKTKLKLVNAPHVDAAESVAKLARHDEDGRMVLFQLQRSLSEPPFCDAFLQRGGLPALVAHAQLAHGNTLAYALAALATLLQRDDGWAGLDDALIGRLADVLCAPSSLVNVCRPATLILKRLVDADPRAQPGPLLVVASSSRAPPPAAPPGSIYRFGFDAVWASLPRALPSIVSRIGQPDTQLAAHSLALLNSLLNHATDAAFDELQAALHRAQAPGAVAALMRSHVVDELRSAVLDFQAAFARVAYRNKNTPVQPSLEPAHDSALSSILVASGSSSWATLLDSEDPEPARAFPGVGVLGLYCLQHLALDDPEWFRRAVAEQAARPRARRCPLVRASNECAALLAEHWALLSQGTSFQPFFLNFYKVHALAARFFLRIWDEAAASAPDFGRVSLLVRAQLATALRGEAAGRAWHELAADLERADYRALRERQVRELAQADASLDAVPVRALREKLAREAGEFVRQQRLHCLSAGAWFARGVPVGAPARRPSPPWRFLRLDRGMKYLHYVDAPAKFPVRDGLEDLPERIELSLIAEIATGQCFLPPPPHAESKSSSAPAASPLSISLLTADGGSAADLIAPDAARWADWSDALTMLRRDGGAGGDASAGFVAALTEIGLKIKLLDLSGDKVEIPSGLVAGAPPANSDFYFSDFYDPQ